MKKIIAEKKYKRGVSLIAVLLLMLVATIAGTATYKWLSSANTSSASRMQEREAYQAASAGITNAKTWMSYHASDVGALIRQYIQTQKPIRIDSAWGSLKSGEKQKFSVYLTGVNTEKASYTLKLISVGESRNGSQYSETAIISVDGLYRVRVPEESSQIHFNQAFSGRSNRFVATDTLQSGLVNGDFKGNQPYVENEFVVAGNIKYEGSAKSGGDLYVGGNLVNSGAFTFGDELVKENVVYVGGNLSGCDGAVVRVYGDLYVNGDVASNCVLKVSGNVTINGTFVRGANGPDSIGGNLVFTDKATWDITNMSQGLTVEGNVYMPKNLLYSSGCSNDARCKDIDNDGDASNDSVSVTTSKSEWVPTTEACNCSQTSSCKCSGSTCQNGWGYAAPTMGWGGWGCWPSVQVNCSSTNSNSAIPGCTYSRLETVETTVKVCSENIGDINCGNAGGNKDFTFNGSVYSYEGANYNLLVANGKAGAYEKSYEAFNPNKDNKYASYILFTNTALYPESVKEWKMDDEILKNIGNNYWSNYKKMLSYQKLITDKDTIPTPILLDHESDWVASTKDMNNLCADPKIKEKESVTWDDNFVRHVNECYKKGLNENFLYNGYLVLESTVRDANGNANVSFDGKIVFKMSGNMQLRLPSTKSDAVVMLYFENGWSSDLMPANGTPGDPYNYFIYSKKNVNQLLSWGAKSIEGSFILADGATLGTSQGGTHLKFSSMVVQSLADAGIIKENPDFTERMTPSDSEEGSESSGSAGVGSGSYDSYFAATSPQLEVRVLSEYKNGGVKIDANSYASVRPSVMVMPRIVYLSKNPVGSLSDYYNVLYLNGADTTVNGAVSSCEPGGLPTSGPLYDGTNPLSEDIHVCSFAVPGYEAVPFYVVVRGTSGKIPSVSFTSNQEISKGESRTVSVLVPVVSGTGSDYEFDVYVSEPPSGWEVSKAPGVSITGPTNIDGGYVKYTVKLNAGVSGTIPVFNVQTNAVADQGKLRFVLAEPCSGCQIGSPSTHEIFMLGSATINRESLESYCASNTCSASLQSAAERPDCKSSLYPGKWVEAKCSNMKTAATNEVWSCAVDDQTITLKATSLPSTAKCVAYVPEENNSVENAENGGVYSLYASLKRKAYKLTVSKDVREGSASDILVENIEEGGRTFSKTCEESKCEYEVYADEKIKLTVQNASSNFSYYSCGNGNCGITTLTNEEYITPLIQEDLEIVAVFGDRDDHCGYTNFSEMEMSCSSTSDDKCIDVCRAGLSKNLNSGHNVTPCSVKDAVYGPNKKNWVSIVNNSNCSGSNDGDRIDPPQLRSGGELNRPHYDGNINCWTGSDAAHAGEYDYPTILLNRIEAGANGTMTSYFETDVALTHNARLQSGFIFRSNENASEYFTLFIYGIGEAIGETGNMYAKVCKVYGSRTDKNNCEYKQLENGLGTSTPWKPTNILNRIFALTMDVKDDQLTVNVHLQERTVQLSGTQKVAVFDLSAPKFGGSLNDAFHKYVGIKLAAKDFKVIDFAWKSETYSDAACWAYPSLMCSFMQNYLGGRVPKDEAATPWVVASSFYQSDLSTSCGLRYLYNGCDVSNLSSTNQNCGTNGKGAFWESKNAPELSPTGSSEYIFTKEGPHGTYYEEDIKTPVFGLTVGKHSGYANSAYVTVACDNDEAAQKLPSTLADPAYCGEFFVGNIENCSENANFMEGESSLYCAADKPCELFNVSEAKNLRESNLSIVFDVEGGSDFDVSVVLVDADGNSISKDFPVTATDPVLLLPSTLFMDESGFDIQRVTSVVLTVHDRYAYVKKLQSVCPYTFDISSCSVSYNGETWSITTDATNFDHCVVKPAGASGASEFTGSCQDIKITESNVYETVGSASSSTTYKFEVTAYSDKDEVKEVSCEKTFEPAVITCSIDSKSVAEGRGVPKFTYSISNYVAGAKVKLKLDGTSYEVERTSAANEWKPENANVTPALTVGTSYSYTLDYFGKGCSYDSDVTFNVEAIAPASVTNCSLNGNKFTANIVPANDGSSWTGTMQTTDPLGNLIGSQFGSTTSTSNKYEGTITRETTSGTYYVYFFLNGGTTKDEARCHSDYTVAATPESSSSVASSSSSVVAGAVTATCNWEGSATSFFPGQSNVKLQVSGIKNLDSDQTMTLKCGSASTSSTCRPSGTCDNLQFSAPNVVGEVSCTLGNTSVGTICSPKMNISAPLSCSVTSNTVGSGDKFRFTGTRNYSSCHNCKLYTSSKNYLDNQNDISDYEITFEGTSETTFTYECQCDNISSSYNKCTQIVAPEITEPTCEDQKLTAKVGSPVSITPSGLTGCGVTSCSYEINEGGVSVASGTNYKAMDGALKSFDGESIASTGDGTVYTLLFTNSEGSGSCSATVKYVTPPTVENIVLNEYGVDYTFTKGKVYGVTCGKKDGTYRSLCCKSTDGSGDKKFMYDGDEKTLNPGYWGASGPCDNSSRELEVPSTTDMKCSVCS